LYTIIICYLSLAIIGCGTQNQKTLQGSEKDSSNAIIVNKGFPFFEKLKESEKINSIIQNHEALENLASKRLSNITTALQECQDVACYVSAVQWSDDEIDEVGEQLVALYKSNDSFKDLATVLKEDGSYKLYEDSNDTTLIKNAWENASLGVNYVLDVYLKGEEPIYPEIDSISFKVDHGRFISVVQNEIETLVQEQEDEALFFELPLQTALKALELNGRDEAARYEPLNEGYNQKPFDRIDNISWNSYEYSMILIPGQGPQERGIILDSLGIDKIHLALERYEKGLAPYMVVSGGHVHPYKTPFCEAVEMKKYMMEEFDIPDQAIFIEPYARHTTTNLRNVSRMIFRFGIPHEKPVLIVTSSGQNGYINGNMGGRAVDELGYQPYKNLKKLNEYDSEFIPVENSLQANPFDILDP
jgi:hypothetical protein